jgi:putative ABC transport system permease protein
MHRDDEIDKELQFHVDSRIDELVASGITPDEARRRVRLEFGGTTQIREAVRDQHVWSIVNGLTQDWRLAWRSLRATPVVTFVAIASLALGIGANTAIFSLVNGLLLRPLPVVEPQRLALLTGGLGPTSGWSYAVWREIQQRSNEFDGAIAWSTLRFNLAERGETQPANGMFVSGEYFTRLGVRPVIGRVFTAADDVRGGGPDGAVAVISYGFWQRHFGGATSAIGSTVSIERVPFTVVGVTPPEFYGTEVGRTFEVAAPISTEPLIRRTSALDSKTNFWLSIVVCLKDGQSIDNAAAVLRGAQDQIRQAATPPDLLSQFQAGYLKDPLRAC